MVALALWHCSWQSGTTAGSSSCSQQCVSASLHSCSLHTPGPWSSGICLLRLRLRSSPPHMPLQLRAELVRHLASGDLCECGLALRNGETNKQKRVRQGLKPNTGSLTAVEFCARKTSLLPSNISRGFPSLPSNITRDCPPSLLILQGIALLPF